MRSKVTKVKHGIFEIDATGDHLKAGDYIAAGSGEDRDTGIVQRVHGNSVSIGFDQGVAMTIPVDETFRVLNVS